MRVEEIEGFERRLAKALVHAAERRYKRHLWREVVVLLLRHLAAMARKCEEGRGDRGLGRMGHPT